MYDARASSIDSPRAMPNVNMSSPARIAGGHGAARGKAAAVHRGAKEDRLRAGGVAQGCRGLRISWEHDFGARGRGRVDFALSAAAAVQGRAGTKVVRPAPGGTYIIL
jgi:hypothetical protein